MKARWQEIKTGENKTEFNVQDKSMYMYIQDKICSN